MTEPQPQPSTTPEPVNVLRSAYAQLRDRLDDLDLLADFDGRTVFDALADATDEGRAAFVRLPRPEDFR